jgi:hypothetical protein
MPGLVYTVSANVTSANQGFQQVAQSAGQMASAIANVAPAMSSTSQALAQSAASSAAAAGGMQQVSASAQAAQQAYTQIAATASAFTQKTAAMAQSAQAQANAARLLAQGYTNISVAASQSLSPLTQVGRAAQVAQQQIVQTATASNAMGGSMTNNAKGVNQASNALMNLGRVAQDAPFGFIAIQNNLNPLLESFQRLQKETGSVGGSFKALAATMLSGAGIGLALSLVSSLLITYPDLLSAMTKEQLAARDALKAFNDEMGKQQGSLEVELTRISSLVQIARDYSESNATRTNAIKELQKEYPGYLQNINQENINSQGAQKAIEDLTAALERKTKVQAISNLLTKAQEDLYKAQNSTIDDNLSTFEKIGIAFKSFGNLGSAALDAINKSAINQSATVEGLQKNISGLNSQLDSLMRGQAENNDFQLLNPEGLKKTKEKIDQVAETLRKLAIDRDELAKNPLLSVDEKDARTFDLLINAINRLRDLKLPDNSSIIVKLRAEADEASIQIAADKFRDRLKKTGISDVSAIPITVPISFELRKDSGLNNLLSSELTQIDKFTGRAKKELEKLTLDPKAFQDKVKAFADAAKSEADIIAGTFTNMFEAFGEGLANKNLFGGMAQALGEGLKTLGKFMIESSALIAKIKLALNAAFGANPIVGIGLGIGMIALGSIIEKSLPKFAEGGIISGPTVGIMGEYAGAANNPEVVAPLSKLKSMLGDTGGVQAVVVTGQITGNNINLANSRTQNTRRRLYGK